ncbi:MAG TPA: ferredoxin [Mycobacteriales bacterium]|jgi:ferredoxin|nr:ferredoxin [Mycobacteriales bacterium]
MRIVVDRTKCSGLGICESLAPDHFEVNDDGIVMLLDENVNDDQRRLIEDAVAACPTFALSLVTD